MTPTIHATIASIQIGKIVTEGDPNVRSVTDRQWTSAFNKTPIAGPVSIGELGMQGDEIADKRFHGGPEKAILCYAASNYADWSTDHPELEFVPGGFGENLTLEGVTEKDVCIGDHWASGDCVLEISQPRQPCWKVARRWKTKTMTKEVAQTGRTGWYVRVIQGGTLTAGDPLVLNERVHPDWSVKRANDVLYGREVDRMAVHELAQLDRLSDEWKESLA